MAVEDMANVGYMWPAFASPDVMQQAQDVCGVWVERRVAFGYGTCCFGCHDGVLHPSSRISAATLCE